jgi:tetratricopeptide (TPR) repeat protein
VRAKYHVACAAALLKGVRWAEAHAYLSEAQRANPDNPLIYFHLALYAERKNDWKDAIELYARSIQLQKDPKQRAVFQARMEAAKVKLAAAETVSAEVPKGAGADVSDSDGDCEKICAKLLRCKEGPWDTAEDCSAACEGAQEDRIASRTYRCVARAKSCSAVARCAGR